MSDGQGELREEVYATYSQFFLAPLDTDVIYDPATARDLLCVVAGNRALIVMTGWQDCRVGVTVRILDDATSAEPDKSSTITEQAVLDIDAVLRLSSPTWFESFTDIDIAGKHGSGPYNVRCQRMVQDTGENDPFDVIAEEYLLEFWPFVSSAPQV